MRAQYDSEVPAALAAIANDLDDHLPKSRGRCFDIGTWGGCGVTCAAFVGGECEEPQEFEREWILEEHGAKDAAEIFEMYPCFSKAEGESRL